MPNLIRFVPLILFALALQPISPAHAATDGKLQLNFVDVASRQPLPVRVELMTSRGRPVRSRGLGEGQLGTHFYLQGTPELGLRRGDYTFRMDAGPEFKTQTGHFTIQRNADDSKTVEFQRFTTLSKEGWYAGDLDAVRTSKDLPIMSAAESLHVVPTVAWTFDATEWKQSPRSIILEVKQTERMLGAYAARVEQPGGAILLVGKAPLDDEPLAIEQGWSTAKIIREASQAELTVVAPSAAAWELPVWIATGELDAVGILGRHDYGDYRVGRDKSLRPHPSSFYPGKRGLSRWQMDIYFHLLNCGLQITPVAGSGSGKNDEPLGTNRVYVQLPGEFTTEDWWQGLESGATVVTNGPLLRPQVGGDPPGVEFFVDEGGREEFMIALNLATRDSRVDYLEIIKNGEVLEEVRLADWAAKQGRLPPVVFEQSGWFAVRAVTGETDKYQYALTAPYYVTSPAGPRVSRKSVEFFLAWLDDLAELEPAERSCTDEEIETAREFWQQLLEKSNAP